jgi:hypothetical protein
MDDRSPTAAWIPARDVVPGLRYRSRKSVTTLGAAWVFGRLPMLVVVQAAGQTLQRTATRLVVRPEFKGLTQVAHQPGGHSSRRRLTTWEELAIPLQPSRCNLQIEFRSNCECAGTESASTRAARPVKLRRISDSTPGASTEPRHPSHERAHSWFGFASAFTVPGSFHRGYERAEKADTLTDCGSLW